MEVVKKNVPFINPLLCYLVYIIINKYHGGTPLLYIYFTSSLLPDKEVVEKKHRNMLTTIFLLFSVN